MQEKYEAFYGIRVIVNIHLPPNTMMVSKDVYESLKKNTEEADILKKEIK